ncbi:hypothetical protein [Bradyrhizobium yuanmingense]|nr:hypothetical protein [Bradyrhizobium yuanmingense]
MFGREVVEGQQRVAILDQTFDRPAVARYFSAKTSIVGTVAS